MLLCDEVETLTHTSLFECLDKTKLKLLAFNSDRVKFMPGQTLFARGDEGDFAFVVLSGQVDLFVDVGEGHRQKIREASNGDLIGEMAIIANRPHQKTAIAKTSTESLKIGKQCFLKVIEGCPKTSANVISHLGHRLSEETRTMENPVS